VVIGRETFSAGQQFTNLLEFWTRATLVGEPTGQQTSQYGDHRPLELPSSHIVVQISSVLHQAPNEFDTRKFVPPTIYTPLTSDEYRRGVDPAWQAILAGDTAGNVIDAVRRMVLSGDSVRAAQALQAAQNAVPNHFRSFEQTMNSLGYQLLSAGSIGPALQVFRMTTQVYPRSANAYDSYGEALLTAGRRDEAIASYRRALAIDPQFPPSLAALQRLGLR
jgi:tetratricopeptide (TPR) repeat protein